MGKGSDLALEVKQFAMKKGAHLAGIASVDRFVGAPKGHSPTDLLPEAKSVVVIAERFFQANLNAAKLGDDLEFIPKEDLATMQKFMLSFLENTLDMQMQMIAEHVAHLLCERGHPSLPLPAAWRSDSFEARYALFSHRHAAVLAGLGEIGVNNLLLTPKYGPRVRLNSIITAAEMRPDPIVMEQICLREKCMLCVESGTQPDDLRDFELAGKRMRLADLQKCKADIGVCPVGKDSG